METAHSASMESVLALPARTDNIETLSTKLASYSYAIGRGMSLAAVTGYHALPEGRTGMMSRVRAEMTPSERDSFDQWQAGRLTKLPVIDWDLHLGDAPQSERGLKKAIRISKALNYLYHTDRAEPRHYNWILKHHDAWLPLLKAVARVLAAEKHAQSAQRHSNEMSGDVAQLMTLDKIIKTSTSILQRAERRSDRKAVAAQLAYFQKRRVEVVQKIGVEKHTGKRKRQDEPLTLSIALPQRK